jgi:hypothetical protein
MNRWVLAALGAAACLAAAQDGRDWKLGMSVQVDAAAGPKQFSDWKKAGMEVVELGVKRAEPREAMAWAKTTRAWADAAGVEIWSIHLPYARDLDISDANEAQRQKTVLELGELIRSYKELGMKKMVIHGSYEITKPIPVEDRKIRIAASRKSLAELAPVAESIHAQLALEGLPRACLGNTSKEVLELLAGLDSVGVCLDTNHMLTETTDHFAKEVGKRIVTLHVSDYDGIDERHWLPQPGKGVNNFPAIIRNLLEAGYPGPFLFECAGTAEEKAAAWKRMRQEAGF